MTSSAPRALVIDDDPAIRYALRGILEHAGLAVDEAADGQEGLDKILAGDYGLAITDLQMPRLDGLALLRALQERPGPKPKLIMITAHGSERNAADAIKAGAFDYFKKPFEMTELMAVVRRATEAVKLAAEVERLSGELTLSRVPILPSQAMSRLATMVQRIAPRDVTVLLTGESGTGKERVAEALVAASSRAAKPFVRFNCAALTAELAEAELFGHTRGAFTGAVKARAGLFREADGGTILLDEIGELAAPVQAKLLRVLQEGEVRPVGADQSFKVDARIIAATHRDLLALAAEGKFREDLFYRLKVVHLQIPPLRERAEDLPVLARHFLDEFSRRFGVGPFALTPALLERLGAYAWPGNVRELENAIESLVALSQGELDLSLLPGGAATATATATATGDGAAAPSALGPLELKDRMEAYERGLIVAALDAAKGNRSLAARNLGINRATMYGKLRKYGLVDSEPDLDE
ncbi:MAG TPA: sigma-54 dependent transcriptional regulator [Polyangia bacterium]|nr:sigma-54 dependent transcriptional regulator [Polyangia bacterium]